MAALQELIESIAKAIVEHPSEVVVTETAGESVTTVAVRVAESDLGRVIGKQGRTARSMRTLLIAAGIKQHKRVNLEIVEER